MAAAAATLGITELRVSPEMLASRGWLRFGGAILLVLAVGACGETGTSPTTATIGSNATPSSASAAPASSTGPADMLTAALAPLRAAATFETRIEIDGKVVVSASGRSVGASSTTSVTTSDRTVDYVQVPPGTWAREPGAGWVLVASDPAAIVPLDALSRPLTVTLASSDGGTTALAATYPAAALGLTGDPVAVTITIDGTGVAFRYETTGTGHTTSSTTTLRPAPADPIVAPAP